MGWHRVRSSWHGVRILSPLIQRRSDEAEGKLSERHRFGSYLFQYSNGYSGDPCVFDSIKYTVDTANHILNVTWRNRSDEVWSDSLHPSSHRIRSSFTCITQLIRPGAHNAGFSFVLPDAVSVEEPGAACLSLRFHAVQRIDRPSVVVATETLTSHSCTDTIRPSHCSRVRFCRRAPFGVAPEATAGEWLGRVAAASETGEQAGGAG